MSMKLVNCNLIAATSLCLAGMAMGFEQTGDHDLGQKIKGTKQQVPTGNNQSIQGQQTPLSGSTVPVVSCETLSTQLWEKIASTPEKGSGKKKEVFLVFDDTGSLCYQFPRGARVTEGDLITIGLYGDESKVGTYSLDVPDCALEPTSLQILDALDTSGFKQQSGGKKAVRKFQPIECYNDKIELKVRNSDRSIAFEHAINQYQRFQGTFQVGILWTNLDDVKYSLIDKGNGNEIAADRDDSDGPVYVGSLVVYGIAHHLEGICSGTQYSGRDIINESNALDRLGLALSFGFDSPKDTLGVGLTYEIATGINISVAQLYRRLDVLDDDLAIGDSYSGTIPTHKAWEDDVVWGLSVDGRYLAKFFGSGG